MKILHSADWHLGKTIEKRYSRLDEQKLFIDDFGKIADEQDVDLIIIAGDIYDHKKPESMSESLLFSSLKKLSNNGNRLILLVAGNHDTPQKIVATTPLAKTHGIILVGTPKDVVPTGDYGKHKVINSAEGMVEVEINGEKAVVLTVPYTDEKTLNEAIYDDMSSQAEKNISFNNRMAMLFNDLEKYYRDDTINLATAHLLTTGVVEEGSEKSLGGTSSISVDCFPEKAQYVALGHIHKPFKVPGSNGRVRYSGSPLQFNKKERNNKNQCILIDVEPNKDAVITDIPLKVYKPIEFWEFDSIEEAIEGCIEKAKENIERYVYIEIKTDRAILANETEAIYATKNLIVDLQDKYNGTDTYWDDVRNENREELNSTDLFNNFYKFTKLVEPTEELTALFNEIFAEKEPEDELAIVIEAETETEVKADETEVKADETEAKDEDEYVEYEDVEINVENYVETVETNVENFGVHILE